MVEILIRGGMVWLVMAGIEVLHGILRARFLAPRFGDFRSRQIGVFSGSGLIFLTTWLAWDWLDVTSPAQAQILGIVWLILMLGFEMVVGHFIFRFTWRWLLADFNLFRGRLLSLGMAFLAFCPWWIGSLKGLW